MKKQVLLISSDSEFCGGLQSAMEDGALEVQGFSTLEKALSMFSRHSYQLVILDIPAHADGAGMLSMIRRAVPVPILALSFTEDVSGRIAMFQAGASGILQKPCDIMECAAYAQALTDLSPEQSEGKRRYYTLAIGKDLVIDPLYRQTYLARAELDLTRREFDLLYFLASNPGQVFSRVQLYRNVWCSDNDFAIDETVKTCIKALRRKLAPAGREYIENLRGVGYRFVG